MTFPCTHFSQYGATFLLLGYSCFSILEDLGIISFKMLPNSTRRAPTPSTIHISEIRQRRHADGRLQTAASSISPPLPTFPSSKAIPALGPFPQTTTPMSKQRPTSLRPSSPTSQTMIVARTMTRLSTFTTTIPRSPTKRYIVTVIQTQT